MAPDLFWAPYFVGPREQAIRRLKATGMFHELFGRNEVLLFWFTNKRNFYKDLIVVIACLVVGVSCFLSLECVIKVMRKELLE